MSPKSFKIRKILVVLALVPDFKEQKFPENPQIQSFYQK